MVTDVLTSKSPEQSELMLQAEDHPHWELSRNGNNNLLAEEEKLVSCMIISKHGVAFTIFISVLLHLIAFAFHV